MILYHASDLLWASKIKGTADALGVPARPVRSIDMLRARLAESGVAAEGAPERVRALVVDLEQPDTALELVLALRADPGAAGVPAVAFGPHVETARLHAAKEAGATLVMTRGAFAARLPDLLTELERGA